MMMHIGGRTITARSISMHDLFVGLIFVAMIVVPAALATRSREHEKKTL